MCLDLRADAAVVGMLTGELRGSGEERHGLPQHTATMALNQPLLPGNLPGLCGRDMPSGFPARAGPSPDSGAPTWEEAAVGGSGREHPSFLLFWGAQESERRGSSHHILRVTGWCWAQRRGGDRRQTGLGIETQLSHLRGLKYGDNLSPPSSLNFSSRMGKLIS